MPKKTKIIFNKLIIISFLFLLGATVIFLFKIDRHEIYNCADCNLIIISATNVREDHLGVYGYYRNTSPNVDNFAMNSLVFEDAYAQASWTLPSGTSLLTSLYPYEHKLMIRSEQTKLDQDIVTLADVLRDDGYKTAIFSGGFDYGQRYGVTTRFDRIGTATLNKFAVFGYGNLNSTIPDAIKWLDKNRDQKFFLYLQGFDAHCPFNPPEEFNTFVSNYNGSVDRNKCYLTFNETKTIKINETDHYLVNTTLLNATGSVTYEQELIDMNDIKYLVDSYDGEIKLADNSIGKFLETIEKLGLSNKTIIVIVSEHGDMFGKHGKFMRGGNLRGTFYDDVLHVPLIIRHPNIEPKRVKGLVQLIDVMPTLLDFLNIKTDVKLSGKSLVPLITNDIQVNEQVYAGALFTPSPENLFFKQPTRMESVRNNDWKLIREIVYSEQMPHDINSVSYELYNLKKDPEELSNVYKENQIAFNQLYSGLLEWLREMNVEPFKYSRED